MADFLNLPFGEQTDEQLAASRDHWERCVEDAAGWASAYAAAKFLAATCQEAERRGLPFINKHQIKVG